MSTLKEKRIIILEEDISKVFNALIGSRQSQTTRLDKETWNFQNYHKLYLTLNGLFHTYLGQTGFSNEIFINDFALWIYDEIDAIHILMDISLDRELNKQLGTLTCIYNMLINLTDTLPEPKLPRGVSTEATGFKNFKYSILDESFPFVSFHIDPPISLVFEGEVNPSPTDFYIVTYCVDEENNLWKSNKFTDKDKAINYYAENKAKHSLIYFK